MCINDDDDDDDNDDNDDDEYDDDDDNDDDEYDVSRLGKIEVNFTSLMEQTQQTVLDSITRRIDYMTPQGVSNTLYGLSLMRVDWNSILLSDDHRNRIQNAIVTISQVMNEQEIANTIYS